MSVPAVLALSDGLVFRGQSVGYLGEAVGELVFHTALSGYQEILTDPSYAQQMILFTCPHIGNVGTCAEDMESRKIYASAAVMRSMTHHPSHWRSEQSLADFLRLHQVVGIEGVDTRMLTNHLRDHGACSAAVVASEKDNWSLLEQKALVLAKAFPGLSGMDLASKVTTDEIYLWTEGLVGVESATYRDCHVVVFDYGVKRQMLRLLVHHGCKVTVVPADTKAEDVFAMNPQGVLLSNGPGDPAACGDMIAQIAKLVEAKLPILGICLGHQMLALALGARTRKMAFGHHGANHPVMDEKLGRAVISSQNHGFVVDDDDLPQGLSITQRSLFDGTVQGFTHQALPIISVQGHPEASPGPHDWRGIFAAFVGLMEAHHAKT